MTGKRELTVTEVPEETFESVVLDLVEHSWAEILSSQDNALSRAVARIVDKGEHDADYGVAAFNNFI